MTSPGGSSGDYNANVVLTANAQQYQQQMAASTDSTNKLNSALGTLTSHLDGITKRAGKRLMLFSAADLATLAGVTATAANFESQMAQLKATTDVTGKSFAQLQTQITNTFQSLPVARSDVIALAEAITQLGVTSPRAIGQLTTTFIKLGAATGENAQGLAQGLIQLSRQMGTNNTQQIGNFANALLTVSKNAGVSATGVLDFAQAIAPLARTAGISESAIMGISAAFSKAGADGYVAANAFNTIISDITNLIQTGSPELAKYSNLIGVTMAQFRHMNRTTALTDIFEAINKEGPRAIQTLNQLGIDGIRAQSAISAVVQTGQLQQQIARATGASHDQRMLNKSSQDAMSGLTDQLARMRNQFTELGTIMGTTFLKPLEEVVRVMTDAFQVMTKIIQPFAPIISAVGALAAGLTAMGGAALIAFGIIAKFATLRWALGSTPLLALRHGIAVGRDPNVINATATRAAEGSLMWYQKPFFKGGTALGQVMGEATGTAGPSIAARAAAAPFIIARKFGTEPSTTIYRDSTLTGENAYLRSNQPISPTAQEGTWWARTRSRVGGFFAPPAAAPMATAETHAYFTPGGSLVVDRRATAAAEALGKVEKTATAAAAANAASTKATTSDTAAKVEETKATTTTVGSMEYLQNEMRLFAGSMITMIRANAGAGMSMLGTGLGMAGRGLWGAASGMLTSPLGMLGIAMLAPSIIDMFTGNNGGQSGYSFAGGNAAAAYNKELGQAASNLASFTQAVGHATSVLQGLHGKPVGTVAHISSAVAASASGGYKPLIPAFQYFKGPAGVAAGASFIQTIAAQRKGLDAAGLVAIQRDLVATVGRDQAQRIVNAYLATQRPGHVYLGTNYTALGGLLNQNNNNGSLTQSLVNQAFTGIQSQFLLAPGNKNSMARLAAVLSLGGRSLQGVQTTWGTNPLTMALSSNLKRMFGTNGMNILFQGFGNNYNEQQLQNYILGTLVTGRTARGAQMSPSVSRFLQSINVNPKDVSNFINQNNLGKVALMGNQVGGSFSAPQVEQLGTYVRSLLGVRLGAAFQTQISQGQPEFNALSNTFLGRQVLGNKLLQSVSGVSGQIANPQKQFQAQEKLIQMSQHLGKEGENASLALQKLADTAQLQADPALQGVAQAAATQQQQQYEATVLPTQSRQQQTAYYYNQMQQSYQEALLTGNQGPYQQAQQNWQQQMQSNLEFARNMFLAVRNYNVQTGRSYQDYYRQVRRSNRDFQRQMLYSEQDYQLQIFRMRRDFNIQLKQQAIQAAQSIYNPYQRVYDQQVASTADVLFNLRDQNRRIQQQYAEIQQLHAAGLSMQAIHVLDLANPQNAQQLQELTQGMMNNPNFINQINSAVKTRMGATTRLTQSDFNTQFQETINAYHRQFHDMTKDYNTQRDRALTAQKTGLHDMAHDFHLMIDRAAQDLHLGLQEITGSFADMMRRTFNALGRYIGNEAPRYAAAIQSALDSLRIPNFQGGWGGSGNSGNNSHYPSNPGQSRFNPNTTPGTMGINPYGQIGHYGPGGKFYAAHHLNPRLASQYSHTHISNRRWAARHTGLSGASHSATGLGLTRGRIDQGVDFSGRGPVYAAASGTIVRSGYDSGWGGTLTILKLDNPPSPDRAFIYYAENIVPSVHVGEHVRAGQKIGEATGGIEIGWAAGKSGYTEAHIHGQTPSSGDPGRYPTGYGKNFWRWLNHQGGRGGRGSRRSGNLTQFLEEAITKAGGRPNKFTLGTMAAIAVAEGGVGGGPGGNLERFNPFNTTHDEPGAKSINSVGVKAYPNWAEGVDATAAEIRAGHLLANSRMGEQKRWAGWYGSWFDFTTPLRAWGIGSGERNRELGMPMGPSHFDIGGILKPGVTVAVNATGKNEFVLTNEQMRSMHTAGMGSTYNTSYQIYTDSSSTFRDITVVASDPNAMAKQLLARARLAKLTNPPASAGAMGKI